MLRNTFAHLPKLGFETETRLWESGAASWDHVLAEPKRFRYGSATRKSVVDGLLESQGKLDQGEHQFFAKGLGLKEAWRAFPEFRSKIAYVDIETDGGRSGDAITVVGLFDGENFEAFVRGDNLESFRDRISCFSMIVTFFGSGFDVPMLQKRFRDVKFDQIHLDLCPTLRRLGFRGGLKSIEKQVGIARVEETQGLTGFDAIKLWNRYLRNRDDSALETLIAYNREDVVNLEFLAELAYKGLKEQVYDAAIARNAPIA